MVKSSWSSAPPHPAEGIAHLYSNSQGRGGCILSCFFILLCSLFICARSKLLRNLVFSEIHRIPHLIQSTLILWLSHFSPFFFLNSDSISSTRSAQPPTPSPRSLWIHQLHSTVRQSHMTRTGSIRAHPLPCTV